MRSYVERAISFIHQIDEYLNDFNCDGNEYAFCRAVNAFNNAYNRKVQCEAGSARVCLITSDYVVKLDYHKENIQYIGGCEDECKMYHEAELSGYSHLFAKITPYEYNGRNYYIMPRVYAIAHCGYWEDYVSFDEMHWIVTHISDLHSYNYGMLHHQLTIFDYACKAYCHG